MGKVLNHGSGGHRSKAKVWAEFAPYENLREKFVVIETEAVFLLSPLSKNSLDRIV